MKKILAFFMCSVMIFSVICSVPADGLSEGMTLAVSAAEKYDKDMLPYCFDKLTSKEQDYYLRMRNAVLNHKSSLEIKMPYSTFDKLTNILCYLDVKTFFNIKGCSYRERSKTVTKIVYEYRFDAETYKKIMTKADEAAETVISKFDKDMSKYDKVKYIHDYIIKKAEYDKNASASNNIYGALYKKKAKCDGYAHAFSYICAKAGIPSVIVVGDSKGEGHAWNKVCIDKKWYNVDVTWDDPVGNFKDNLSYAYFMLSDKEFSRDHTPDKADYYVPEAVTTGKDYYTKKGLCAKTKSEAMDMLASEIAKAADKGGSSVTIKLADKNLYNEMNKELSNPKEVFNMLKKANKKSKASIITDYCKGGASDEAMYYVTIVFFRKNTKMSDYFKDVSKIDSKTRGYLKKCGIKEK